MSKEKKSRYYLLISIVLCLILSGTTSIYLLNQQAVSFVCPSPPTCQQKVIIRKEVIVKKVAHCDASPKTTFPITSCKELESKSKINNVAKCFDNTYFLNKKLPDGIVKFGNSTTSINKKYVHILEKIVATLKNNPSTTVRVDGYADQAGMKHHNYFLSESRAARVTAFLMKAGIALERIQSCGHGSAYQNARRVELRIIDSN
ncbi:MAG: OmpA family protein [Pseudomonadota bacterium]|nr:OmpA family protein [Pseudomonadota bacterium]